MRQEVVKLLNDKFIGHTLTGSRATGLLHATLEALKVGNQSKSKVLLPALTCTSVAHAVLAANLEPVFVDVGDSDFNSRVGDYKAVLSDQSSQTLAVIGIHQYGHLNYLSDLKEMLVNLNVPLIEDACLFFDSPGYKPVGDFLLNSFGHNKPVEAGAGASITLRNPSLGVALNYIQELENQEVESEYINHWYGNNKNGNTEDITSNNLIFEKYRAYLLYGTVLPDWNLINRKLTLHESLATKRRENWTIFAKALENSDKIRVPAIDIEASNPWRFTFTLNQDIDRLDFTERLRKEIIHASNWYSSLSMSYPKFQRKTPVADSIGNSVVNLWIDDKCSAEYLSRAINFIERY